MIHEYYQNFPHQFQTWIDERLFGWSRSAQRGTSAWGGVTPVNESSRSGTPNETDDEEAPDYDNVLGYFPDQEQPGSPRVPKSRSRNSSYADLQRLRMTNAEGKSVPCASDSSWLSGCAASLSATMDGEGLHPRHGHRSRRQSLSDSVPVERIAAMDPQEPFKDATLDINNEILRERMKHLHED